MVASESDHRADHNPAHSTQRMPRTAALLAAVLLLACAVPASAVRHLSAAPAPAPSPASSLEGDVTSGASYITEARFACPSGFKLVNDGVQTLWGPPDIIPNRTQVELAWLNATAQYLVPQGICNRYVSYTAHPSQTPGLENFTAVVEYYMELSSSLPFSNPLTAQTTLFASQQMETVVAQSWPSDVVLNWVRAIDHFTAGETTPLNVTNIDTADIISTLQLQGNNLVPFTFDKQMLFIQTALHYFQADSIPVGLMNFSDWQAAESAISNSSADLVAEGIETITVDVWTTLLPYDSYTPLNLWSKVAAPDARFWNATGAYNVSMNLTWMNSTMYARPKGQMLADVTEYTTAGVIGTAPESGDSSSGRGVGIGVGVAAAVVILAVIGGCLYMRRRRQQRVGMTHKLSTATSLDSHGSSPPLEGEVDPHEFVICRAADGTDVCLGEGNFGKVYKAIRHGTTEVAIKKLSGVVGDKHTLHQLRKEIAIMKKVSYDANVVQFYGACTTEPAMLVMEYMEGGDLRNALWRELNNGTHEFDWYHKGKDVALAVARGLNFLHNNNVVHRDVKSSNILLTRDGTAKVGDVGLAVMTDYFSSASAATGTFAYAAPEILMGKPTTSKVDCFSYGVVLWEIITKEQTQRGNWRTVRVPEECPAEVEELLQDCLTDDVERRPTMKQIVDRLISINYNKPVLVRDSAPDVRDSADSLTQDQANHVTM